MTSGIASVVATSTSSVGTRSAGVRAARQIGLFVVDEEHDGAYKQTSRRAITGVTVAIVGAREHGALVVLGSATPSLESAANARAGRYQLVRLTRRVLDRPLAAVRVVDMREEFARAWRRRRAQWHPAQGPVQERLGSGEQSLILLNPAGFRGRGLLPAVRRVSSSARIAASR
jgi:primosomal protein N' (replication factor Y)